MTMTSLYSLLSPSKGIYEVSKGKTISLSSIDYKQSPLKQSTQMIFEALLTNYREALSLTNLESVKTNSVRSLRRRQSKEVVTQLLNKLELTPKR